MNSKLKISKLNHLKKPLSHKSKEWVCRHINDPFVKQAKKEGYISRAAYKLIEIQAKYRLIQSNHNIVELGSAPGGWTQVITNFLNEGRIFAVDLQEMEFFHNKLDFIHGNFIEEEDRIIELINQKIIKIEDDKKIHGLLSDMAPAACGDKQINHWRIMELCYASLEFAKKVLIRNGYFVTKIFMGGEEKDFFNELKKHFKVITFFKPDSSRKDSTEIYIVAKGFLL